MQVKDIVMGAKAELSRREFFFYCCQTAPDFYKEDRTYLKEVCGVMQNFLDDSDHDVLVINLPP